MATSVLLCGEASSRQPAARICTEKGAAIDSFYVQEIGGGKILHSERQKTIERRLRHAIHELEKAG
jgi:hypothetical protein